MSHAVEHLLKTSCAGELVWDAAPIIDINIHQDVREALKIMSEHNIVALPVRQGSTYKGIVSVLDCLMHVTFGNAGNKLVEGGETALDDAAAIECLKTPVSDIMGLVDEEKVFWSFHPADSLAKVGEALSKGVHRCVVGASEDINGKMVYRFLSQIDFVRYLALNFDLIADWIKKPIYDIMQKELLLVNQDSTALDAFRRMQVHGLSAVPIVAHTGEIVTQLSASDVRGLTDVRHLTQNCIAFRQWRTSSRTVRPLCLKPDSTIEQAISRAIIAQVHRLWVVDDNNKPIGVVSLTDIISSAIVN